MSNRTKDIGMIQKQLTVPIANPAAGANAIAGGPYKLGLVDGAQPEFFPAGLVQEGRLQVIVCNVADAQELASVADGEQLGLQVTLYEDDGVTVRQVVSGFATASDGAGLRSFSPEIAFSEDCDLGLADVVVTVPTTANPLTEVAVAWKPNC